MFKILNNSDFQNHFLYYYCTHDLPCTQPKSDTYSCRSTAERKGASGPSLRHHAREAENCSTSGFPCDTRDTGRKMTSALDGLGAFSQVLQFLFLSRRARATLRSDTFTSGMVSEKRQQFLQKERQVAKKPRSTRALKVPNRHSPCASCRLATKKNVSDAERNM